MSPEDIAAILKDAPLKQLLEALSILDPDMIKIMESINMIRSFGYGIVEITVADKQIMGINTTLKTKLRWVALT